MTTFLVSSIIFILLMVSVGITEVVFHRRTKKDSTERDEAILEIACIANERHKKIYKKKSTILAQNFPNLK